MDGYDVELRNATKRFGDVVAVDDVSLAVKTGEFVSIIGPSGCGKTTTMRMIAGLDQPDAGEVIIRGQADAGSSTVRAQRRPRLPELRPLSAPRRCSAMSSSGCACAASTRQSRRERAVRALRTVGLEGFERRRVGQLSGGQRQRVALARALVVEPALILLDEPLGSLDARLRIDMQSELKSLQQQLGITFIHVSHNQGEALAMADRIVVMNEGRFEQVDTPAAIYGIAAHALRRRVRRHQQHLRRAGHRPSKTAPATVQTPAGDLLVAANGDARDRDRLSFVVRADRLRWLDDSAAARTMSWRRSCARSNTRAA